MIKKLTPTLMITYLLCIIIFSCSSQDSNNNTSSYKFEIVESLMHEENLRTASYDEESNRYLLVYDAGYDLIKFEVRDVNFNIIRSGLNQGNYFGSPHTVVMINDSLKIGNNTWNYYKTHENLLIRNHYDINQNDDISFYPSENTNTTAIFTHSFDDYLIQFYDTNDYIIFSAIRETCYFIRKSDDEVISFKNRFINHYNTGSLTGGGSGVGIDEKGRIILSADEGVLVYDNNEWQPFWDGELDKYSKRYSQFYLDSKNKLYAKTSNGIIVFDTNTKKKLLTISGTNEVDFSYCKILGEHPDGSILVLTDFGRSSPTNRIFKIKVVNN